MGATTGQAVLQQVGRLFGQGTLAGRNDAELLARFLHERDELAFEALIARHGPMVLSVCRHLIGRPADVDDAFQATFLILVRRAGSLRQPERLGPWLYGVAHRVASRVRVQTARRAAREVAAIEEPFLPAAASLDADVSALLHQEVHRLPGKYRDPIVLCYFEGQTHETAAALLGWPVGTVRGRLARARELLRSRLTRRGITLPAAAISAWLVSASAEAAVRPGLIESTTRAAVLSAAGSGAAGGTISATILNLMEGVLHTMFVSKLRAGAVLLVMLLVSTGAAVWAYQGPVAGGGSAKPQSQGREDRTLVQAGAQPAQAAAQPGEDEQVALLGKLDDARIEAELLETQVESEQQLLRSELARLTSLRFGAQTRMGLRGSPEDEEKWKKQNEEYRRDQEQRIDVLKMQYVEDSKRLTLAKRKVSQLERTLGREAASSASQADIEARLAAVEKKLDRMLKAIETIKTGSKP